MACLPACLKQADTGQHAALVLPALLSTCSSTPIFFILFPGYSPSKDIEEYARKLGKTVESGDLTLISMGQGQEGPAEAVLDRYCKGITGLHAT